MEYLQNQHPWVRECFFSTRTEQRVLSQHSSYQVLACRSHQLPRGIRKLGIFAHDRGQQVLKIFAPEWRKATQQEVKNHACAPHVDLVVVLAVLRKDFRSDERRGAAALSQHGRARGPGRCESKVCNLDSRVVIGTREEDVFQLQVAVHQSGLVHAHQRFQNLEHNGPCVFLAVGSPVLKRRLQVTAFH